MNSEFEAIDADGPPDLKYTNLPSLATDEAAASPPTSKLKVFSKANNVESRTILVEESKIEDEMGRTAEQFMPLYPLATKSESKNALAFALNSPDGSMAAFDNVDGRNDEISKSTT